MKKEEFTQLVQSIQDTLIKELNIKIQLKVIDDGEHMMVFITTTASQYTYPILRSTGSTWKERYNQLISILVFEQKFNFDNKLLTLAECCSALYIK